MTKATGVVWYLFWIGVSLVCLGLGVANYFQERVFLSHAELDTGTITLYELHVRNDGKSEYCPRIEFTDKAGEPVAVLGNDCPSRPDKSKIGQTTQVYYDPNQPDAYEEKTAFTGYDGLLLGLLGAVFFGLFWFIPAVIALARRLLPAGSRGGRLYVAPSSGLNSVMSQDAQRYHANQMARERAEKDAHKHPASPHPAPPHPAAAPTSPDDDEARLAQLQEQEAELQRKIEEHRRQQGPS